jgi:hypothetical protein
MRLGLWCRVRISNRWCCSSARYSPHDTIEALTPGLSICNRYTWSVTSDSSLQPALRWILLWSRSRRLAGGR